MRRFMTPLLSLLLAIGTAAFAADTTPQAAGPATAKKAKPSTAASATAATGVTSPGTAPNAGGSGGGVGSNKGTSGQQIGPKKPKCPDPTVACPAERSSPAQAATAA